jgi:hypothetical protein
MVAFEGMAEQRMRELRGLKMKLGLSLGTFKNGVCPLDPESKSRLEKLISEAMRWKPEVLWFDHLRFDGHWEAMKRNKLEDEHLSCEWCRGKDRVEELVRLAEWIKSQIGGKADIGFFAVPFKAKEAPLVIEEMGQDVRKLGVVIDVISPMLYHRLIGKPVEYIHEFVNYVSELTGKPVLPIIQIKDLPDEVADEFEEKEIRETFTVAAKAPSAGVAWFCWDDAVETGKTEVIRRLFAITRNSPP